MDLSAGGGGSGVGLKRGAASSRRRRVPVLAPGAFAVDSDDPALFNAPLANKAGRWHLQPAARHLVGNAGPPLK